MNIVITLTQSNIVTVQMEGDEEEEEEKLHNKVKSVVYVTNVKMSMFLVTTSVDVYILCVFSR